MTTPSNPQDAQKAQIRRLMIFFALVYVAEGLGQVGGLISQPLNYYFVKGLGWQADRITEYLAILTFPWVIKPLYGLVSDFVPLLGYRRRTYLFAANGLAVAAYLWLTGITAPGQIVFALLLTAFGMAISSTLCGAVMVENGKKTGMNSSFVNQQWLWFYIATVITSFAGGWLCQHASPAGAFHSAALIVALAPIGVMLGCWFLVQEEKARINMEGLKASGLGFWKALKSKTLWVVGFFLFFYNFSPSFGTPLYVYMTNQLEFSQDFIGILGAIGATGAIVGSLVYMWLQRRMTLKALLNLSILLGTVGQGSYLLLGSPTSAVILGFVNGVFGMIALVASLTLAADYCPDKAEGFSYALLMSLNNLAGQLSANVGAYLYVHTFSNRLSPLIIVSAAFTAAAFLLVPMLRLGNRRPGQKVDDQGSGAGPQGSDGK